MNRAQTTPDPRHVSTQARLQMIEYIMHCYGCGQPNPRQYWHHLNAMDSKELAEFYHKLLEEIV